MADETATLELTQEQVQRMCDALAKGLTKKYGVEIKLRAVKRDAVEQSDTKAQDAN